MFQFCCQVKYQARGLANSLFLLCVLVFVTSNRATLFLLFFKSLYQ